MAFTEGVHDGLLMSQRNTILNCVRSTDLDPNDFVWQLVQDSEYPSVSIDQVMHRPTGFYFTFGKNRSRYTTGDFYVGFSPAEEKMYGETHAYDWESVVHEVYYWLGRLKREWEQPDLWAEASRDRLDDVWGSNNSKFSSSEQRVIKERMEDVRAYLVKAVGDNQKALADINSKVDYLVAEAKKQGRRDWLMMVYGYVFNLCATWSLNEEHLKSVMHLVVTGMRLLANA